MKTQLLGYTAAKIGEKGREGILSPSRGPNFITDGATCLSASAGVGEQSIAVSVSFGVNRPGVCTESEHPLKAFAPYDDFGAVAVRKRERCVTPWRSHFPFQVTK
jgi:hypothetical protein